MRYLLRVLIAALLVLTVSGAAAGGAALYYTKAPDTSPGDAFFRVRPGDSLGIIAEQLENRGFIRSALALRLYARIMKTDDDLQTGYYSLPPGASMFEVHDILLTGKQFLVQVTIPEGLTLRRIAQILEEKGIVKADDFIAAAQSRSLLDELGIPGNSLQGYLYPDTYRLPLDAAPESVLRHMAGTFFGKLEESGIRREDYAPEELHETVILASIVEREYRLPEEAPLIASVFKNRLEIRMPLQSCATVVYVLTEEMDRPHPEFLTYRDLEVSSDFNTYRHYGLPPAPICNPGRTALKSAFSPADTDYLYFLVEDPEIGRHRFTTTLSEHNQAKQLYIKGR
ncbi:endolytic transglycosylase MltG [Marispirochaeta aestuarii]|uniref:endolytic transglycosylase MltG n=1 Tax=Marispirochaeta aestuarii TaxID=1963862 RepID=UPI0029C92AD3|nr:endolytic transglycosylase MltG [Marispirochaeta aestuarii]